MWFKRRGLLSQKVILIRDNARPYRVHLIQTLPKDFYWEQFKHHPYSRDLPSSDYYLFSQLKKEFGGQRFLT